MPLPRPQAMLYFDGERWVTGARFTVVTRSGAAGHGAVGHAQEALSVAPVHAPIPFLQTEEDTVADKEKLKNSENVITTTAQFMAVTRSGPPGLSVASPVMEERNNVIVHAPIHRLQRVEKTVTDWDELQHHGNVIHLAAQFMVVTHSGVGGIRAANPVVEDFIIVIVHAPNPDLKTAGETAADWGKLQNLKDATYKGAQDTTEQGLPFLDTITTRSGTQIEVNVYRKATHTDRYLDFNSYHPECHKRSVVCTLLRRAKNIPSTQKGKREETKRVKTVLRENNYPSSFINKCERSLSKPPADLPTNGFVVLPYVQGISEKIGRILKQQEVKVAYKPLKTVNSLFPRPKAQNDVDRPKSGVVYRIGCTSCNFVYYGQTERALKTRIAEHKRAVASFDHDSKVSCHVHENNHQLDFNAVDVVGHEPNFHERLFLEAWLSIKDPQSGNDHITVPEVYKSLARA
ncbi:hypothetical protein ACROYT_G032347 [Oculina patagonica]